MATADILVAIDCDQIMADNPNGGSKDPNNPTWLDANKYFYMITKVSNVISGNAGGELNIGVDIGDNIRWREVSLSNDFENSPSFTNFREEQSGGANLITLPPTLVGGVSNGQPSLKQEPQPVNAGGPPWAASMQSTPYHFWQSTAQNTGKATYQWIFQILDTHGTSHGYFGWDPFITISD